MANTFKDGQSVEAIFFSDGAEVTRDDMKSMTISMEAGQMAQVPWVRCVNKEDEVALFNCAEVQGVMLSGEE